MNENYINEEDHIFTTDTLLNGFTIQDLIDVSIANGEDIYTTLDNMLEGANEYAREMVEMYGEDISNYINNRH